MIYNIYAVGDSLRNIRKKYGYTQNDMAESLGISYTHYSQIEQGRHHMSMQLMMKIVSKYGVDPNSLLGIQKERQSPALQSSPGLLDWLRLEMPPYQ